MELTRRATMAAALATMAAGALPAGAQTRPEAEAFIRDLIVEVEAIVKAEQTGGGRVDEFMSLFRRVAALPQIGRFVAGQAWREMSPAQQEAYMAAFERYAANAYSRNIGEYNGQTMEVVGSQDAGRRGVLVNTRLLSPGEQPLRIDWLVSDRGGNLLLSDVVAEGVSLTISQREEFAAMLEARNGNLDEFIADLGS
jgi:phospholipid transport system substrate-binding protein